LVVFIVLTDIYNLNVELKDSQGEGAATTYNLVHPMNAMVSLPDIGLEAG
jgi:hypothetical protein